VGRVWRGHCAVAWGERWVHWDRHCVPAPGLAPTPLPLRCAVNLHHGLMSILEGASSGANARAKALHADGAAPSDTIGAPPTGLMWLLAGLYMCLPGK